MLRPSINTNILSAKRPPKPRAVTDQLLASIRATCRPGTMRSTSGMLLTPERRMSSCVITYTAPAVWLSFCSLRPGELTSKFIRVSRLASARSPGDCGGVSLAQQAPARSITRGVAARDSPETRVHNLAESAITMPIGGARIGLYSAKLLLALKWCAQSCKLRGRLRPFLRNAQPATQGDQRRPQGAC